MQAINSATISKLFKYPSLPIRVPPKIKNGCSLSNQVIHLPYRKNG